MLTVYKKEVRENLRDRRTIMTSLLIGPLAGPLLFVFMMMMVADTAGEKSEELLELAIVGQENAPNLVAFLEQQEVVVKAPPADPEAAILAKDEDVIVRIPPEFPQQWLSGEPATVEVIADNSRRNVGITIRRVKGLLRGYGSQVGVLRLQLRGIPATLSSPLYVRDVDLSTATSRAAELLAILPYFLMLTAFIGGMHLAIDTTAGEKERKSLEPLLINPVPRWQIMAGKLLTTTTFALLSLTLTMLAFSLAIPLIPADKLGIALEMNWGTMAMVLIVVAPVSILAAALLTILASFAKSFREAQSYMGLVVFVPLIPSLWLMVNPLKADTWMMTVPLLSQNVLIYELIRGESIGGTWLGLSILTTAGLGFLLAIIAATLYNRPRIIFGSG
jgi:sodium transport system permease protein